MSATRATHSKALKHFVDVILGAGGDGDNPAALFVTASAVTSPNELMILDADDIDALAPLKDSKGDTQSLPLIVKKKILKMQHVYHNLDVADQVVDFWLTINNTEFEDLMIKPARVLGVTSGSVPSTGGTTTTTKHTPAEEFKKGSRRSLSDYQVFRDRKHWGKFQRSLIAIGNDHGIENVLDPAYRPGTAEEIDLFDSVKKFAFSVFSHVLQEPTSVRILRKYSTPGSTDFGDSQKLYDDLVKAMTTGASGKSTLKKVEGDLVKARLNKTWTKTRAAFMTYVMNLVKDHQELAPAGTYNDQWYVDKVNDTLEEDHLMRTYVSTLETQAAAIARVTGTPVAAVSYDNHTVNLVEHATTLDDVNDRTKRRSNNTDVTSGDRGRGRGGRGSGRGNDSRGRGGRGSGSGTRHKDYVPPHVFAKMTAEQKKELYDRRNKNSGGNGGNSNSNGGGSGNSNQTVATTEVQATTTNNDGANTSNQPDNQNSPGAHLRNMLSNASARGGGRSATSNTSENTIMVNGVKYRSCNVTYHIANGEHASHDGSLVDSGANGGLLGEDVRVLEVDTFNKIDVTGVGQNAITGLNIAQGAAVVETMDEGPIVVIMSQYANHGKGKTIHSKSQLEHFGGVVNDSALAVGGRQSLITPEGYIVPLHVRDGLFYMDMHAPSDEELRDLPHVFLTSDAPWDPSVLDHEFHPNDFGDAAGHDDVTVRRGARDMRITARGVIPRDNYYEVLNTHTDSDTDDDTDGDDDSIPPLWQPPEGHNDTDDESTVYDDNSVSSMPSLMRRPEIYYDGDLSDEEEESVDGTSTEPFKWDDFDPVNGIVFNGSFEPSEMVKRYETEVKPSVEDNTTWFGRILNKICAFPQKIKRSFPDLDTLKPNLGWVNNDRIQKSLEKTTQFYRATDFYPFRKHYKSRFPAANVRRLNEWYGTDTYFSDVPATDDGIPGHGGCTMAQVYNGLTSDYVLAMPMREESDMPETLEEFIRKVGAMRGLFSDNAKSEMSRKVKDIQRMYCIDDAQSEPHYQNQNKCERRIQDLKRTTNNIMDRTGTPAGYWLICLLFTCGLFNHLVNSNGVIPIEVVTGEVADISAYLTFHWWQEVFVATDKSGEEVLARWCGPAHTVGDKLTYWVLLNETKQLVARSNVRPAKDALFPNRRQRPGPTSSIDSSKGEIEPSLKPVIRSVQDCYDDSEIVKLPKFSPDELIGLTFVHETEDDQKVRATIVRKVLDRDAANHQNVKFILSLGDGDLEEIISYNELSDLIENQHKAEEDGEMRIFSFREVLDHQGPLNVHDPRYKGSSYNVKVLWEDGTETWEPLNIVGKDDPATVATYAKEKGLLETPGWKFLRRTARRTKFLQRMLNASKRQQAHDAVRYKFGVRVPRNVKEALQLDRENGNTYWADAMREEIAQLNEYKTFRSAGFNARTPDGYQRIPARMIFDVKNSLKRKARFVAGGHKTRPPDDSVYSGVASLRSLRIVAVLAELNGLKITGGDVGNAYLEAFTSEKVVFTAGPEFGEMAGHTMIIVKALYGLRTSGKMFHEKFAHTMRTLNFVPTYADPDVWMRDAGDCYEYVCVYVDDLFTALKDPDEFFKALTSEPWNYKLKGVEEPKYHLGGDFFRDKDGTFCYGAQTYVKRLVKNYEMIFGETPQDFHSPMDKDDHPEMDTSPLCGPDDTSKFQSMIGALQWTISLCRLDVAEAVMSMSRFRHAPRVGHIDRIKRVVGYMKKYPHAAIRFRTGIPDHEAEYGKEPKKYSWMETVYAGAREDIPANAPEPKGKLVRTTSYKDANLMHDLVTGRSCTGVLHFLNQTPIEWFCKRQDQVETATYGSEFMAARQAIEQIIDLRYTLRMFGVPLDGPSWLFGDNKSVVNSSTIPHSTLSKRWNALSYHRCREAVAAGYVRFEHIAGDQNPSDILTKPLPRYKARVITDPLLFWKGETDNEAQAAVNSLEALARGECYDDLTLALDGVAKDECGVMDDVMTRIEHVETHQGFDYNHD